MGPVQWRIEGGGGGITGVTPPRAYTILIDVFNITHKKHFHLSHKVGGGKPLSGEDIFIPSIIFVWSEFTRTIIVKYSTDSLRSQQEKEKER